MATIYRFEDLEIWQLSRKIYQRVSRLAEKIRRNNKFRFADQLKAAAGSIMDNITEGFERNSRLEYVNSLSISKGEAGELKSQYYRALDDGYIDEQEFLDFCNERDILVKKLASLIIYLNKTNLKGLKFKNRNNSGPGKN